LNDTIIDRTTALLASICAEYNAKKKKPVEVAVFDSRFASLIIEHPVNSDPPCYNYKRVRGYGDMGPHQRRSLSFELLVFPNNIHDNHWIIIVVFPKQSLIVAVDSLRMERPVAAARTIFRWLYNETRYHWPADNTKMFGSHLPDRGWVFRVDSTVSHQTDTWNCGVFVLGYVVCFLFEMNPNKLKPDLIEDYRVRLFCDFFDEQVLVDPTRIVSYPPSPWASTEIGTPSRRIKIKLSTLPSSPLSPENALRSTSRRLTLPSSRAGMSPEVLQSRAKAARDLILATREQKKRQIIRKEQKNKRDALEAEKKRLKKETADRELARENADHKVDALLADRLAAALKTKGRTHEKKLKALLDKHFFTIETPPVA
jgi:hypothetical protein